MELLLASHVFQVAKDVLEKLISAWNVSLFGSEDLIINVLASLGT